ncbi:ral-GDS-related protein-like isoform X2 [Diceros bicornis minor]|uniref:ral-GDS-related protein-like isoform X2 n=1 Tax=Diceros bicornis minor TaxID=77932 RepID=UPI0026E9FA7C|nr:ral-GDS-related protein-like isoform X2 [Diceros bicornis minor]
MAFLPKLVVEQLTVMDAELFRKVVPSQCLGSTWGKRKKHSKEHLAHTIRATINHFRRVASLVVTTCLGDPSMTAQDRECEILKNFSSSHTVIYVLKKTFICHLKNTWGKFPGRALKDLRSAIAKTNP